MSESKYTQLKLHEDRPTAISSTVYGANMDTVGFNLTFVAARNPKLAVDILKLYAAAHQVQKNDPKAPDEDFALFADEVIKTLKDEK